jgi:hypothetical protein
MRNNLKPSQRGATTLLASVVLLFAMTLAASFANRNLVFEQRSAANFVRSTEAFEAAEAGVEWTLAMLNLRQGIGADCLPTNSAEDRSFRERHLRFSAADGMQLPLTWDDAGKPAPLLAACVRDAEAWGCSCPASGLPSPATPRGAGAHPAFSVQLTAGPKAGLVRLIATGCTSASGLCGSEGGARIDVLLALVPGLSTPPAAPLTAKDGVSLSGAVGVHNPDAVSGGVTVHSGGSVVLASARVTTTPGSPSTMSFVERDAALASATNDAFFAGFFGLDKNAWRDQPAVTRLTCESNCAAGLAAAIGDARNPLVWIDGDLAIEGPTIIGSRERPVMLVASGMVRFKGGVVVHGLVYGASVNWDAAGADTGLLRGAVVSQGGVDGSGSPDLFYDTTVLTALKGNTGTFARVPGSWKDF